MAIITTLITGALTGLIISTTGVGGGVIVLPILTYLYGMNALMAVATANLLSMLMKVASSWLHYKLGNIPLRRAMIVLPATFGASLLVTWLASVPAWQDITEKSINLLVVAAILFSLWLFIQRMFFPPPLPADTAETSMSVRELLLPGITAGVVLGATGVGGGIVVLPMLLRYAKMDIRQAIGTSIFVTTLLSGSSAIAYMQDEHTDVRLALWLFAGSLLSMPLTKILLTRMPDRAFQYATLFLILCSAVMMTLNLF